MQHKYKYIIIGAGPTGIGAAYKLNEYGIDDFLIVEAQDFPGGLATSFVDKEGFTWDIGGHVQFSHYDYFDQAMEKALGQEGWNHHQRESWVWMRNRFIPYPFQNNIHRLPEQEQTKCLQGLKARDLSQKPNNFDDWLKTSLGQGIYDCFLEPYNFKVWAYHPEKLNHHWVSERVATVDLKRIEENIRLQRDDVSWGPNNTFQFPKSGGTGAIWKSLASQVAPNKVLFNSPVKQVYPKEKAVELSNGQKLYYQNLLSTMPLDQLANKVYHLPPNLKKRANELLYSSTHIVGIGVEGLLPDSLKGKCWMYFPEENCPFYRVTVFSHYAKNNVPNPSSQFSLMAEVSESPDKPVNSAELVEEVIQGLKNCQLFLPQEHKVASRFYFKTQYGYPTPSLERDAILKDVMPELEKLEIYSRGRFGGWKYEVSNQDHTFMQGVEWIEKMEEQKPERTFHWK